MRQASASAVSGSTPRLSRNAVSVSWRSRISTAFARPAGVSSTEAYGSWETRPCRSRPLTPFTTDGVFTPSAAAMSRTRAGFLARMSM